MNKVILFLMSFAIVAFTSCSKESSPGTPTNVTFNLSAHAPTPATKAVSISRYIVEVYASTDLDTRLQRVEQTSGTFSLTLDNATNYVCLFWADGATADDNTTGTYNALNLKSVTLNTNKEMEEAFFTSQNISGSILTHNITLTRPMAQVNFVADTAGDASATLAVTYSQYTAFNASTGDVTGTTVSTTKIFDPIPNIGVLGSVLTFVSSVGLTMDFSAAYTLSGVVSTNTMPITPLKANHVTNLLGNYATAYQDFTAIIVIDDYWANTIEWVEINVGTSVAPIWIKVADRNALKGGLHGATAGNTATDYGYYYQWSNTDSATADKNNLDKAYQACFNFGEGGGAWRLPTKDEWVQLVGGTVSTLVGSNTGRKLQWDSALSVWRLYSERTGKESEFVYFPLPGFVNSGSGTTGTSVGTEGSYWTSTVSTTSTSNLPWYLYVHNSVSNGMWDGQAITQGFPVRCVRNV